MKWLRLIGKAALATLMVAMVLFGIYLESLRQEANAEQAKAKAYAATLEGQQQMIKESLDTLITRFDTEIKQQRAQVTAIEANLLRLETLNASYKMARNDIKTPMPAPERKLP